MAKQFACLLIHGFGGGPAEIQPLAADLSQRGYLVRIPVLKGHTGSGEDLRGVRYTDWIASAETSLLELKAHNEKIIIAGFSMGGLIAVNLAVKYEVAALITMNTPIFHWDFRVIFKNIGKDIQRRELVHTRRYLKNCSTFPLGALLNFRMLLDTTIPLLPQITCPFYIIQAREDDTARKESAVYIRNHIASTRKELCYIEATGHQLLESPAASEVILKIGQFIESLKKRE
jgi:carboxylesterase